MRSIDITHIPELRRLAEEVQETGESLALQRGDEPIAVLSPPAARKQRLPRLPKGRLKPKKLTDADRQAFLSAAGGWSDIDADKLIEDIYAAREVQRIPPDMP